MHTFPKVIRRLHTKNINAVSNEAIWIMLYNLNGCLWCTICYPCCIYKLKNYLNCSDIGCLIFLSFIYSGSLIGKLSLIFSLREYASNDAVSDLEWKCLHHLIAEAISFALSSTPQGKYIFLFNHIICLLFVPWDLYLYLPPVKKGCGGIVVTLVTNNGMYIGSP